MNPAEAVTAGWLISKGYFVMQSVKFGRREADLLALRPNSDAGPEPPRLHVEVTVSSSPTSGPRSRESCEKTAHKFLEKYTELEPLANKLLNGPYERWLVLGKRVDTEEERVWQEILPQHGVTIKRFDDIVREYVGSLDTRPLDFVGQLLHILRELGLLQFPPDAAAR